MSSPSLAPSSPAELRVLDPASGADGLATHPEERAPGRLRAAWERWGAGPIGLHPLAGLLVVALAVGLRMVNLERAYEVFIDEITYARIAQAALETGGIELYGGPFYLHPPLYFYLQAAVMWLFGLQTEVFGLVHALRITNVVFAGLSALLILRIATRMGGSRWGGLAALVFCLNAFIIRFDSRVLLETVTMFWILLGYTVLLPLLADDGSCVRRPRGRVVLAGFVFGLAMLTKETSAPLYVLPLGWCLLRGAPLARRLAGLGLGMVFATYLVYPLSVVLAGDGGLYAEQKFGGLLRMAGLNQETGFNAEGAPSFLSRIVANLDVFAVTYLLIGLGLLAAVVLVVVRHGTRPQQMLLLWTLSAFALLTYQVGLGTLEEQMFYYLVIPSTVAIATAGGRLIVAARSPAARRAAAGAPVVLALLVLGVDGSAWAKVHVNRDDGFAQTVDWMHHHAPNGARVEALAESTEFLLDSYRVYIDDTKAEIVARRPHYLITSSSQVEQGYGRADRQLARWIAARAKPVHRVTTRSSGTLTVWQTDEPLPLSAPPAAPERRIVADPRALATHPR